MTILSLLILEECNTYENSTEICDASKAEKFSAFSISYIALAFSMTIILVFCFSDYVGGIKIIIMLGMVSDGFSFMYVCSMAAIKIL